MNRVLLFVLAFSSSVLGAPLFSFSGAGDPWPLGTLAVGDLDDDGELEIVVPLRIDSNWSIDVVHRDGSHQSGFPKSLGESTTNLSPTLADITGDGKPEILFTAGTTVWALDGTTGATVWSKAIDHGNYVPDSGYQTPVGGFYWNPGGAWLARLPSTSAFSSEVSSLLVADTDNDGDFEVITGWKIDPDTTGNAQDFNPALNDFFGFAEWGTVGETWSGGVVLLDAASGDID